MDATDESVRSSTPVTTRDCNTYAEELNTYLTSDYLQRAPSAKTVAMLTIPKYDTLPRSKKETEKKHLIQSNQSTSASTENIDFNVSENRITDLHSGSNKSSDLAALSSSGLDASEISEVCQNTDSQEHDSSIANDTIMGDSETRDLIEHHASVDEAEIEPTINNEILTDDVCIECVTAIQVFCKDHIHPGDHIFFPGRIYDHHAIVIGVCDYESKLNHNFEAHIEIVHATNTAAKAILALFHPFGYKAVLRQVNEIVNFKESKVMVYKYSKSINPFPPHEIVRRATEEAASYRDGKDGKYKYNLFDNNCEHFATWCVTGRKLSIQVRKFTLVFWMFLKSGFYDISDEKIRNKKEYENGILCKACYSRNQTILDIPHISVYSSNDVNAGDVIVYSYFFLWHNAVVLRKIKSRKSYIKCEIAHYAYLGLFKHRTILKEELLIPLDGTVLVLKYPENKFNMYNTKEVVQRAESRIGEQMFSFFRNDSCQFSRWCKLKLEKSK